MTSVLLRKTLGGKLEPLNDAGRQALSALPVGEVVRADIVRPRNVMWHRRYWAALQLIFDNQSRYKTVEHLHAAIKVALGHADLVVMRDGREVYVPRSESFAKMTQEEFAVYWERFCDLVTTQLIPGLNRADLERELTELIA